MPELPEVEIIRQSLDKKVKNKIIQKVLVKNRNLRFKIHSKFERHLYKKKIKKVDRFSKYLILIFEDKAGFIIHLGMSGTIHLCDINKKETFTNTSFYHSPFLSKKHNHVELIFDSLKVIYNDPRRFGFFQFIKNSNELRERFNHLGHEPFDKNFNLKYVSAFFRGKNKEIKSFLIDQRFVSGIGNIYASEILFLSKINPNKKVKLLNKIECSLIIKNSKKVLRNAIKKGGSSIRDFKNTDGNTGSFQDNFNVYQREGLNCKRKRCKGKIIKKMTTNRSTFFCNFCQK